MAVCLISDTKTASPILTSMMIASSVSRVLVIDSAGPDLGKRGGSAAGLYKRIGLDVTIRDIVKEELPDLSEFDAVHFSGGNPYRLMKGALATDLQSKLEDRMGQGDILIIGSSAGAMVLGRTIDHAKILCPNLGLDDDRGFGWFDSRIMPHVDLNGSYGDRIREHVNANPNESWLLLHENDLEVYGPTDLIISQVAAPVF